MEDRRAEHEQKVQTNDREHLVVVASCCVLLQIGYEPSEVVVILPVDDSSCSILKLK
jgi:hypothetical protein